MIAGYLLAAGILLAFTGLSLAALVFAQRAPRLLWLWVFLVLVVVNALLSMGCSSAPPPAPARPACQLVDPPPLLADDIDRATDDDLEALRAWAVAAWRQCAPLGVHAPYPPAPVLEDDQLADPFETWEPVP